MNYFEKSKETEIKLKVWFVYRYLYNNPFVFNNINIEKFFYVLDDFYKEKFTRIMGTKEKAINEILYLFQFESERTQIISEQVILDLIDKYEEYKSFL